MNFLLSNLSSIYSITTTTLFIHPPPIFLHQKKGISKTAFCGLRPHPASGIRLGSSGNTSNASGIRLGRLTFYPEPPWTFLFINTGSAFPHIIQSAGLVPDPSHGISESIFSWYFHWPDRGAFPGIGHLEIHFCFWSLFGTDGSTPQLYLSCTWFFGSLLKTGKRNLHPPSCFPSYG